jgi:hypothetical protein
MINGATFAFDESRTSMKSQLLHLSAMNDSAFLACPDGSVDFPRPEQLPELVTFSALGEYVGTQFKSLNPRLAHRINLLTNSKLRGHFALRNRVIKEEIAKSLERLESGDEIQFSAVDHVLQREMSVAKKEGRSPDFYSNRVQDEVTAKLSSCLGVQVR